ncbi:unnamed protein product [Acanthoscelides obtectus]|nr:unnamed protein product [Acanthoscelides obtectus]CAK1665827.1 hypothetical protein AOBTE_LOCUS24986 [Acanthoscelides obtectus]
MGLFYTKFLPKLG